MTTSPTPAEPVLINGQWRPSDAVRTFAADNPTTREPTGQVFPVSSAREVEEVIRYGHQASLALRQLPVEKIAHFLELYASRIEAARAALVDMAHIESALPKQAPPGRGGAAPHREPAAPGRGGRARGDLGAAHHRHQGRHSIDVRRRSRVR